MNTRSHISKKNQYRAFTDFLTKAIYDPTVLWVLFQYILRYRPYCFLLTLWLG